MLIKTTSNILVELFENWQIFKINRKIGKSKLGKLFLKVRHPNKKKQS